MRSTQKFYTGGSSRRDVVRKVSTSPFIWGRQQGRGGEEPLQTLPRLLVQVGLQPLQT